MTSSKPKFVPVRHDGELIAFRESSVVMLGRRGILDAHQIEAAFRFRNAFEVAKDAARASIGFHEWTDPGKPAQALVERRSMARNELKQARFYLGAHGYWLVGKIAGEGYAISDLYETRRERDTASDMLQIHLTGLSRLWEKR